ncbi:c-type cytochrome [Methylobacter sp.]|uniref:c-type cytochrome n=1 Tax=Methylobacter sp. TaxID=2051955 RepID=UPI003DA4DA42
MQPLALNSMLRLLICLYAALLPGFAIAQADAAISRGAYLARAGDCVACHTAGTEGALFAGGLPINSPFGIIYSTNITPDPETGIGRYTLEDFSRALRNGVAKGGKRLYPAMPYASFAAITDDDIRALYDYFMKEVNPVRHRPPETRLPFPFNQRWTLLFWNMLFVSHERFEPSLDRDAEWNRGAYLVQSLGHCGACHTPRGLAFQEKGYTEASPYYLTGAVVDNWFAANLTGAPASGLGRFPEEAIASFLGSGHSDVGVVFGNMVEVIENSTKYLRRQDLKAIAHYLKSLPARSEKASYEPDAPAVAVELSAIVTGEIERPGVGIYQSFCAKCHKAGGEDETGKFPKLAGNPAVLARNPASLIHLTLEGGEITQTQSGSKSEKMPSFAGKLSDRQIAEVLSFIRNSWGNAASPVTTREVLLLRETLRQ